MIETYITIAVLILLSGLDPWLHRIPLAVIHFGKLLVCLVFLAILWFLFTETPFALRVAFTVYVVINLWRIISAVYHKAKK
jgi:hypothetical protein